METRNIKISICRNDKLLEDELNYVRNVFIKRNDYPPKLLNSIKKIPPEKNISDQQEFTTNAVSKQIQLVPPYAGKHGNDTLRKMNRRLHKHLKDDVNL